MSRKLLNDQQPRFDGGTNPVSDEMALAANQFRSCENMRLTQFGALTLRGGSYIGQDIAGTTPNGGAILSDEDGEPRIVAVFDGEVHVSADIDDPWTAATGDTFDASSIASIAQFRDATEAVVYIADGTNVGKMDPTNVVTLLSPAIPVKSICVHNQRLWAVGDPARPQSLLYSGLNDGDTLGDTGNGGGEIIVRTYGDDRLVAVASVGSSLLIFHERGVSRLTGFGQDDTTVDPEGVSRETGLIAPWSIIPVDGGVFCITERGAYFATESGVNPLGSPQVPDPILPILLSSSYFASYDATSQIIGALRRQTQELWWLIPGNGTYVYNMMLKAWSGPFTTAFQDDLRFILTGNLGVAGAAWQEGAIGLYDAGVTTRLDVDGVGMDYTSAAGPVATDEPFPWSVQLRRMYFGDDYMAKAFRWLYLTATMGPSVDVAVSYQSDITGGNGAIDVPPGGYWDEDGATWDEPGTVWYSGGQRNYRVPLSGTGYYLDVTISSSGGVSPVTLSRVTFDAYFLGRR